MPLLLLLLLSDPTITSQTRDADHHVIVAEFGADLDRAALQAQLQREAERLCAGRHPRFGEYRFQTDQPIEDPRPASTRTRVEQDLSCVEQGGGVDRCRGSWRRHLRLHRALFHA